MKKKLVLMTSALMAIILLAGCNSHAHDWSEVTYTWSADNATCTAERVCKGDESHKETEVANSTYNEVSEAKCEEDGTGRYSVSFTNEAFSAQTKDVVLEAIGHNWGAATYVWADDNSTCTATRVCSNDSNHIETETVNATINPYEPATCTEDGYGQYTATFTNTAFATQSKDALINRLGHDWGAPTYVWSEDNSTCTARRVCAHDATHVEEETATAVEYVTISPTCTADGEADLIVSFENKAFENQVKEHIPVKTTGHNYIFDSFVWADDYSSAQAKYVCFKDSSHIELYDAIVSSEVVTDPTCEEEGVKEYYAIYEDHKNTVEVKIPALGHKLVHVDAEEPKCAVEGNVEHWHCTVCEKNYSDSEGKNLLNNVIIPSKGHTLVSVTYEWSADHKTCTAKGTCSVCHEQATETVNTAEGELESTDCYLYGLVASFKTKGFEPQIYDYYRFTLNSDNSSYTVYQGNHSEQTMVIPGIINNMPVTILGNYAFDFNSTIRSLTIPKTVKVLSEYSISYTDITTLIFEEGSQLEVVGASAFKANYDIASITLPSTVTSIGSQAFAYCDAAIYYLGTKAEWEAIPKGYGWNECCDGSGAIHCIDGDVDNHWVDPDPFPDDDDDDDWYD